MLLRRGNDSICSFTLIIYNVGTITAKYQNKVVAVASVTLKVDTNELKQNFEIDDFIFFDQHTISDHAILNFLFIASEYENKRRYFLKVFYKYVVFIFSGNISHF